MGELEDYSLWYYYKSKVWSEDTPQAASVHNIMRVLRSIGNNHPLGYFSVAITSGKLMYDKMIERGVTKPTGDMFPGIIEENFVDSFPRYKDLKERVSMPLIFPHYLVPARQKWSQDHFQALWLSILGELCTHHYMDEDWWMSNGGSEEFVSSQQLRLGIPRDVCDSPFYNTKESYRDEIERMKHFKVYDLSGNALSIDDGIEKIQSSIEYYGSLGFDVSRLETCVDTLAWTQAKVDEGFFQDPYS